jgi:hypothetical protein
MTGGSPERSIDGSSPSTTTTTTMTDDLPRAAGTPPSASHRETMDRAAAAADTPADPSSSSNSNSTDATGGGGPPPRAGLATSLTVRSFGLVSMLTFHCFILLVFALGGNGIMDYVSSGMTRFGLVNFY